MEEKWIIIDFIISALVILILVWLTLKYMAT